MSNLIRLSRCLFLVRHGADVEQTILEAIQIASKLSCTVGFDYFEVSIQVNGDSDAGLILRDYRRAKCGCIDKEVGPYPSSTLSEDELTKDLIIKSGGSFGKE